MFDSKQIYKIYDKLRIFKKIFSGFTVFLFSLFFAQQNLAVDTAQVITPNRFNSTEAVEKPYLIFISTDGYRYDYTKKYRAENLMKYSNQGVSAAAMLPSFPSITFPNHWSLITGLYPSHHGLVDNFFYDYSRKEFYAMNKKENAEDGSWYGGIPLWSLAENKV